MFWKVYSLIKSIMNDVSNILTGSFEKSDLLDYLMSTENLQYLKYNSSAKNSLILSNVYIYSINPIDSGAKIKINGNDINLQGNEYKPPSESTGYGTADHAHPDILTFPMFVQELRTGNYGAYLHIIYKPLEG